MSYTTFTYANLHESHFIADFMDTDEENDFATELFSKLFDIVLIEALTWYPNGEFYAYCDDADDIPDDYDLDKVIRATWDIIDSGDIYDYCEEMGEDADVDHFLKRYPSYKEKAEKLHAALD